MKQLRVTREQYCQLSRDLALALTSPERELAAFSEWLRSIGKDPRDFVLDQTEFNVYWDIPAGIE